jgi:hypothetical protein
VNIGNVVLQAGGRLGVVIDAWPLSDPRGVVVRWEPLLSGEVETFDDEIEARRDVSELTVVWLRDVRL